MRKVKTMMTKSPSGALSPYYYKGGYFHGIHYGDYFQDREGLFSMMEKEELFILNSPEQRRILMDFYQTEVSPQVLERILKHIVKLQPKIIKLAVITDRKTLRHMENAMKKQGSFPMERLYFGTDMEDGKTWLVSDGIKYERR